MSHDSRNEDAAQRPLLADQRDENAAAAGITGASSSEPSTFSRSLGTLAAFSIVVSIVIGSGVFTSPGSIDSNVPSPGMALIVWVVGGGLAWTGVSHLFIDP
ncbi:uncharacterized protein BCR38DRAFT_136025 [Pseudomassariella vexata]|uniref:Uncharacterized protein n=1 Tax=Pseudomassariella vexata TaxID=1141098 RepID=A0A1Y2EBI5_9PEZI|nr:uncharacterized protein BCR38DRAFT_136025 [Pseudomassariella vexata]ORY68664.1 hypothetical protein BCR38DRAFT_136025 [Pseudomassariella vexata]